MTPDPPGNPHGGPAVQSLSCPNCGGRVIVRSMGRAVSVVCDQCCSILDARSPQLRILQRFHNAQKETPPIPLGTRGKWRGTAYEVAGYQRRETIVEGERYSWREYLLFNPYKGFRYFTEYDGHWNDATAVSALPQPAMRGVTYLGTRYKYFQECIAKTAFVLGEFPWQVSVGDSCDVTDYIAPPYLLSSEKIGNETTWTQGEYIRGEEIWKAFDLIGAPPLRQGVFENQPNQAGASAKDVFLKFAGLAALFFVVLIWNESIARREVALNQDYHFTPGTPAETSFVTPEFRLNGRTSSVEIKTWADVSNQWIYLNYTLINEDTGEAYDFGREVSYYSGTDSDGSWSEGSTYDTAKLPSIPSGRYYLRVEPESDANFPPIHYAVMITRDVPVGSIYAVAFALLLLPAVVLWIRAHHFEQQRWAESTPPLGGRA